MDDLFKQKYAPERHLSKNIPQKATPRVSFNQVLSFPYTHNRQDSQSQTAQDYQLSQNIVRVLRQQNVNLKQQNNFLLQKLRILSAKQQQSLELQQKHSSILEDLRIQNIQLKRQLKYSNELANSKVQQFGKKLAKMTRESEQQIIQSDISIKQLNPPKGILEIRSVQSDSQKTSQQLIVQTPLSEQKIITNDSAKSQQQLNNQFQAILYSCKVQKYNNKKRDYRKRLVELTYKMKELKKD